MRVSAIEGGAEWDTSAPMGKAELLHSAARNRPCCRAFATARAKTMTGRESRSCGCRPGHLRVPPTPAIAPRVSLTGEGPRLSNWSSMRAFGQARASNAADWESASSRTAETQDAFHRDGAARQWFHRLRVRLAADTMQERKGRRMFDSFDGISDGTATCGPNT